MPLQIVSPIRTPLTFESLVINSLAFVGGNPAVSGVSSVSAENNPLGAPNALSSGVSSVSAENNPTAIGNGIATVVGVSSTSAENNPLGFPNGLTTGVSNVSTQNAPIGEPVAVVSGNSATSVENNPLGNPYGLVTGDSTLSSENDPTAIGTGIASPSGVSATSVENNPLGLAVCMVSGLSVSSGENNPVSAAAASVTGVTATSVENNPTITVSGTSTPAGTVATSSENLPTGWSVGLVSGVSITSSANNPAAFVGQDGNGFPVVVSSITVEDNPVVKVFAAAAGSSSVSSFVNPTVPPFVISIDGLRSRALGQSPSTDTVSSFVSSLNPAWTVVSSAGWLSAVFVDPFTVNVKVTDSTLPQSPFRSRPRQGEYTAHIRLTSAAGTKEFPVTYKVGYGDVLDGK